VTVREYLTAGGIRIARWLGTLDRAVKREVQARVLRFERGDVGDHKSVGAGVWKARLSFGPGYRIYFGNDGDATIVLLAGGPRLPRRRTLNGRRSSGETTWREDGMARRSEDWNIGLAKDLRDPEFAREFLLAAADEGVPVQAALGKVIRAMGVKEFATKVRMASPNVLRAINSRHNPTQQTLNRLLKPFRLRLTLARIEPSKRRRAA
jgi:putative addiction module killer protein